MNKIEISLEQANSIIELFNTGKLKNGYVNKFIFEKYAINIKGNLSAVVITKEGNIKFTTVINIVDSVTQKMIPLTIITDHGTPSMAVRENDMAFAQRMQQDDCYEELKKDIGSFIEFCHAFMLYVMTYQRDRKEKHSVPRKYSREHRISTSQNKIYLLDDIVKYVYDNYVPQGGTHNIQCECWGVRGHYRTYKSGKKIWINAFKKGKKRNETEPKDKTYYLSKGAIV